jgi:hypothetical protein
MKIQIVIGAIYKALTQGRRKGYSTELLNIAKSREDVLIICPTEVSAKRFEGKGISMHNLESYLTGKEDKLFLVDNHTLLEILKEAANKMADDETQINKTHALIQSIESKITDFRNINYRYNNETTNPNPSFSTNRL